MASIGFIGIGLMGHGMAKNLIEKGHRLTVMANRSRERVDDLVARGATEVDTPREVAAASEIIFTCVPTSNDVEGLVLRQGPSVFSGLDARSARRDRG